MIQRIGKGLVAAMESADKQKKIDEKHIEKGAFHTWLGKAPGEKITAADIEKGLASDDPKIKKMAQFAKNAKKWKHGKSKVATESNELAEAVEKDKQNMTGSKPAGNNIRTRQRLKKRQHLLPLQPKVNPLHLQLKHLHR